MNIKQLISDFERERLLEAMNHFADSHPELNPLIKKLSKGVYEYADNELILMGRATYSYLQDQHLDKDSRTALLRLSVMFEEYALTFLKD